MIINSSTAEILQYAKSKGYLESNNYQKEEVTTKSRAKQSSVRVFSEKATKAQEKSAPQPLSRSKVSAVQATQEQTTITFKNNFFDQGFIIFFDDVDIAGAKDDAFFLINASPSPMTYKGLEFSCAENAYHMMKYPDRPDLAQRYAGKDINGFQGYLISREDEMTKARRKDWYEKKPNDLCPAQEVFLEILLIKFQDPELRKRLLATKDCYLVEHWPQRATIALKTTDARWADGHNGTGENWMGELLMKVRGMLGGTGVVPAPEAYKNWVKDCPY